MNKNRFKNYGLWLAGAALFYMILQDVGIFMDASRYQMYIDLIMFMCVALGIVNNPTTENKWFIDDKSKG